MRKQQTTNCRRLASATTCCVVSDENSVWLVWVGVPVSVCICVFRVVHGGTRMFLCVYAHVSCVCACVSASVQMARLCLCVWWVQADVQHTSECVRVQGMVQQVTGRCNCQTYMCVVQ